MAYTYYLNSAQRGNIDGSIHLADVWTTGIPGRVKRRPADAVLLVSKFICFLMNLIKTLLCIACQSLCFYYRWVKWAAEHNGHLGMVLRKALDYYFKGDR